MDDEQIVEPTEQIEEESWGDALLSPDRPLSPRHRKLAELLAQGKRNEEIAKELHFSESRISVLKSNTKIRELAESIRERTYEESVGGRLKKMAEPALNEIAKCLADNTNRYKENLKVETAKWVVEKLDGKAIQKYDLGENMLSVVMDRLDALKQGGHSILNPADQAIDVTPALQIEGGSSPKVTDKEEEALRQWANDFGGLQKE